MIKGKTVGLRSVEEEDLITLVTWRNNPDLKKYFREYKELSIFAQKKWFNEILHPDNSTLMFSIIDIEKNELIGACGLCYINWINRNAEMSIYIGKNALYIDNYYAADTVTILLEYAFNQLNLHRIYVEVFDFDSKKQKLLEEFGFTREGIFRENHWYNGRWNDSINYSLLMDNWLNK